MPTTPDRSNTMQANLERITTRWWFFLAIFALPFLAVPFASKNFALSRWADICKVSLGYCFLNTQRVPELYFLFKLLPLGLLLGLILSKGRLGRVFSAYAGFSYVLFALVQNVAITPRYGFSFLTANVLLFLLVAASWFWDCHAGKNDFSSPSRSPWRYWVVLPALFAFWLPVSDRPGFFGTWEFSLGTFFGSQAGMAFCLMTPAYLALLSIFHPRVNLVTMRVTSVVGLLIGLVNIITIFAMKSSPVAIGVSHIPLVILPVFTLFQSYRKA